MFDLRVKAIHQRKIALVVFIPEVVHQRQVFFLYSWHVKNSKELKSLMYPTRRRTSRTARWIWSNGIYEVQFW